MKARMLLSLALAIGGMLVVGFSLSGWAQSPDTAGFTLQPYQCFGSTGHRIVLDAAGTAHMIWMRSYPDLNSRYIWYNCYSNGSFSYPGGTSSSRHNRDGYGQLTVNSQNEVCEVFHNTAHAPADSVFFGIEAFQCLNTFSFYRVPNALGGGGYLYPMVAMSENGDFHIIEGDSTGHIFAYTRSINGGSTWSALQVVDSINAESPIVVASPVSNKVCIAYTRNHHDPIWSTASDLMYVQSTDGRTWDFTNGLVNVTNYATDHDSITAGYDIDAIYDYNDELHFVWQAKAQSSLIPYQTKLMHYGVASGITSQIGETSPPMWPIQRCNFSPMFGAAEWHFAKVSIGVQSGSNHLYVAYTDFDSTDCSLDSVANGDIYMNSSYDNGFTWTPAENITNSRTPGCVPGDCESDEFPSMAERVDENAHIFYECVRGGGGIADNLMLYLRYFVNPIGVDDGPIAPKSISLSQNYPNPFNAKTTIAFTLEEDAFVNLSIYGLTGAKIATLANGRMTAGEYRIAWNANNISSGIYYYRLTSGQDCFIKKMLVLK